MKESINNSEDHEVYEQDVENEENPEESEKDETYVQCSDGLGDILEASNENSENLELKSQTNDEIKENEDENQKEDFSKEKNEDLQEKYEEAIKREKELKNIIDIKVKECEKVLGKKTYEEIITFFREKLNVQ